jgi:type IV secretory pathway TrbD component
MDASAQKRGRTLAIVLGSIAALLGLVLIGWIWFDRGELYGAGLIPVAVGLIVISSARNGRESM